MHRLNLSRCDYRGDYKTINCNSTDRNPIKTGISMEIVDTEHEIWFQ